MTPFRRGERRHWNYTRECMAQELCERSRFLSFSSFFSKYLVSGLVNKKVTCSETLTVDEEDVQDFVASFGPNASSSFDDVINEHVLGKKKIDEKKEENIDEEDIIEQESYVEGRRRKIGD
ncbi:hypothetical protein AVEN_183865-1 [Araneus ventricosus]|uniref:Uncharacterized protein n=1 Tax=Araneus ventricosus TaxID=182803 RepID=A0A4Y2FSH6_ARAVE|nr:hypothetical protein AVEN_183865-1 [Araneus ventricosus]